MKNRWKNSLKPKRKWFSSTTRGLFKKTKGSTKIPPTPKPINRSSKTKSSAKSILSKRANSTKLTNSTKSMNPPSPNSSPQKSTCPRDWVKKCHTWRRKCASFKLASSELGSWATPPSPFSRTLWTGWTTRCGTRSHKWQSWRRQSERWAMVVTCWKWARQTRTSRTSGSRWLRRCRRAERFSRVQSTT